jgi:riboflavin synthase
MLVPYTLEHITLPRKGPGDSVNIEVDILAKYMERLLSAKGDAQPEANDHE